MTVTETGRILLDADSPMLVMCPRGFAIEFLVYPILPAYRERITKMVAGSVWGKEPGDQSSMVITRYGDMNGRIRRAATRWAGADIREVIDAFEDDNFFRLQFAKL